MAPSSGGSSLLSVYLGWCYALAPRTVEGRQEAQRHSKEEGKGFNLYAFDGSGPTYAGFSAPPDDPKKDDLRARPPLQDYGFP